MQDEHADDLEITEQRRAQRFSLSSDVRLAWTDGEGMIQHVIAKGCDLSDGGASLVSPVPVATGAAVWLELRKTRVLAEGHVRSCRSTAPGHRIGLEFPGGIPDPIDGQ